MLYSPLFICFLTNVKNTSPVYATLCWNCLVYFTIINGIEFNSQNSSKNLLLQAQKGQQVHTNSNTKVNSDTCFTSFIADVSTISVPDKFTFPFYYEPHELSKIAAQELQVELLQKQDWNHDFGVINSDSVNSGKMFGVLIVRTPTGELGYLKGFSGKLANTNKPTGFVPHIYDLLPGNNFFEVGMKKINAITDQINTFEQQSEFQSRKADLETLKQKAATDIAKETKALKAAKSKRKALRKQQSQILGSGEFDKLCQQLAQESIQKKFYFNHLTSHWKEKIEQVQTATDAFYAPYQKLKKERKDSSNALQQQIFEHYQFLNANGEIQNLLQIFNQLGVHQPPAGAGDCAAPKLLQYAFKMGYTPICMAEFWWGQSPKSEIKVHQNYYPACTGKCQPILNHMLKGLSVDANPMEVANMSHLEIKTIYDDEYLQVISKPSGLLSVPGKSIKDSVATRLKQSYPDWTGPVIVHRLDMPTSGLMLIAKSLETHKSLQQQFLKRTIKKRYIALLDGIVEKDSGTIDLPLRVDLENRPYQMVCYEHGKSARTIYQVLERYDNHTKIHFFPVTGRTHQLRMHAAHAKGLNIPIVGDSLYGKKSNRLHLHAEQLKFTHPISQKEICIEDLADF